MIWPGRLVALGTPADLKREVGGEVLVLATDSEADAARLAADVAAALGARADASARGGPPRWACSADCDPQIRQQPILTHPRDDGTEFLILILKLQIAGCFCLRLAPLCGGRASA